MASLNIGLDLGTKNIDIAAQYVAEGASSKTAEVESVLLPSREKVHNPDIRQIALYTGIADVNVVGTNKSFMYGKDIGKILSKNRHLHDEVLELTKLALHPEFHDIAEVSHVIKVLTGGIGQATLVALQIFFTHLLECIVEDIRDHYNAEMSYDAAWDTLRLVFQISVPAMWGDKQKGVIRMAARKAGIDKVELREEPLCAATSSILELIKRNHIKQGQCTLQLDIGGGTFDISTNKLVSLPSSSEGMVLKRIGKCSGNSAGSQMLNHQLWQRIKGGGFSEIPGLAAECDRLGMTEREFMRQISYHFDAIKYRFNEEDVSSYFVSISGSPEADKADKSITIAIPRALVLEWHRIWTDKAGELLEEHLQQIEAFAKHHDLHLEISCVVVTGSGAKSDILRESLGQILSIYLDNVRIRQITTDIPCAKGALMHHVFQEDRLPPVSNFYITQQELYRASKHRRADVETSQWDSNVEVVNDCLKCIMKFKDKKFFPKAMTPMTFLVEVGPLGRLKVDLWWSERHYPDSSPLTDADGNVRAGIRSYPLVVADLPPLADHGFPAIASTTPGAGQYFEVKSWVEMTGTEDKLTLTVHVMNHGYVYPREAGASAQRRRARIPRSRSDLDEDDILDSYTEEVWDKDSSHFVSSSTASTGSRGYLHVKERGAAATERRGRFLR
jgi:hypothetical protein